ncbi:MAG: DUF4159 domain-containing protein [Rhodospirillales bacterium]
MLELGAVGFLTPWVLGGLLALPLIYRLLRVTPPKPFVTAFPPVRLLARLLGREETPAHTPWWMLLLRMVLAALLIIAGAGPVLAPEGGGGADADTRLGARPAVLVIDNGWPAGPRWPAMTAEAGRILDLAGRRGRQAAVIFTASAETAPPVLMSARAAKQNLQGAAPHPWTGDREAAARRLRQTLSSVKGGAEVFWLSDGVSGGGETALAEALNGADGAAAVYAPEGPLIAFTGVASAREGLNITLARPESSGAAAGVDVRAYAADGAVIARADAVFAADSRLAETALNVPADLRNRIERLEAGAAGHAAANALLDERWRRRPVGLIVRTQAADRPLTGELYYLARALDEGAEVTQGSAAELVRSQLAVIITADLEPFAPETEAQITAWVREGGVFVSFAGPRMAARAGEDASVLIPHPLRPGGRAFGGALTWDKAARLRPFDKTSPFAGLETPEDVHVLRQVLAEPSIEAEAGAWARLEDGTPLVTARTLGAGRLVLFHVTANAEWSNLPLSGLFVNMLERVIGLAAGTAAPPPGARLAPVVTIDGFGRAGPPAPGAVSVPAKDADTWTPSRQRPPGLYAAKDFARAFNLRASPETFRTLDWAALGLSPAAYGGAGERDLRGVLLALAAALFLLDLALSLGHRGLFARARTQGAAAGFLIVCACVLGAGAARAEDAPALPKADMAASFAPRIAWVETGDARVDAMTKAGLNGLTIIVRRRTAAELGAPRAVDPAEDSLALYPLIYWPLADGQAAPGLKAARNVKAFLAGGGMILFDSRNAGGLGAGLEVLSGTAAALDLPALSPIPPDHVLSRSFYLLRGFPGRWSGGGVWTDVQNQPGNDGVAGVIAGGADWAAAWAMDENFRPLAAVTPGGARQRELAFRFGVNLVMYALTGNYKEDQVHIPEILRRLGQ